MAPGHDSSKEVLLDRALTGVQDYLDGNIDQTQLRETVDKFEKLSEYEQLPTVPISSLSLKEIEKVLGLKFDRKDQELQHVPELQLPPNLVRTLELIDRASGRSPQSEVSIRWVINALLLHAHEIATTDHPNTQPLNIQMEKTYTHSPVTWKKTKVKLSVCPYYKIWCGEDGEDICLNVLIVKARNLDIESGVAQALGSMGCIHRKRKIAKRDATVYGMASNGTSFSFLKISNDSKWSKYVLSVSTGNLEQPLGILVYMFRKAIMPPTHSKKPSLRRAIYTIVDLLLIGFHCRWEKQESSKPYEVCIPSMSV